MPLTSFSRLRTARELCALGTPFICCSVLFERSDRSLLQRNYCCVNINPKSSFVRFGMHIELQCNGMTIACIDLLIRDKNVFVPMDITCPYPSEFFYPICARTYAHAGSKYPWMPVPRRNVTYALNYDNIHGCLYLRRNMQ